MSTLFVDRRDIALEHDSGALIIRDGGERIATVPLAPITRVVLRGNAQLTASLLATLGERGIGVLVFRPFHRQADAHQRSIAVGMQRVEAT